MANILLTHSYFYKFDPKQWRTGMLYPPIGTLYIASLMRASGYEVSFFDSNFADSPDELEMEIEKFQSGYLVICDDSFNYLTKMCLSKMREAAFTMISIGKKHSYRVIVTSSDSTTHYVEYLNKGADFVIIGEAEYSIKELIDELENKSSFYSEIKGIAFKENDEIIQTGERAKIIDLDALPLPAWDLANIDRYKDIWKKSSQPFTLNIVTTRGCPYHCTWCAKPIYGEGYHSRSPKNVLEEIEFLMHQYGVSTFWMCDDIFGLQIDWIRKFSAAIKEKDLKFNFIIQSRADLLLKAETIDIYSEIGLKEVWIGAESGSQEILNAMDKGITVDQIIEVTHKIKQKGIRIGFFLQLGYLGETKTDIALTRNMIKELLPDNIGISVSYPLPGTKFYESVKSDLITKFNWVDSDDLAMLFRGSYYADYYKKMHHFIHKEYRAFQAFKFLINFIFGKAILNRHRLRAIILLPYYFTSSMIYLVQIKYLAWKKI
jgi:anaerobic magnesium-protoporphyrin IX monomethyl ester cyclase